MHFILAHNVLYIIADEKVQFPTFFTNYSWALQEDVSQQHCPFF